MKKFKLTSLVLVVFLLTSCFMPIYAQNNLLKEDMTKYLHKSNIKTNIDEKVKVIVELEDKPLLDDEIDYPIRAYDYLTSDKANDTRNNLENNQAIVKSEIVNNINSKAEFEYSYYNTLNGFSAQVNMSDINKIKDIAGVKNVFIDSTYELPKPQMSTSNGMIYSPETWNVGYKGEKTVVAIIDTGVDIKHELMCLTDENNVKLNKSDILNSLNSLKSKSRVSKLTADDLYKTAKVPYSFDYADKDSDASAIKSQHGVHVSGTVAANNKNVPSKFNGVAPEAQIIGMKVFSDKNDSAYQSDTLAAVEDSITLGADVLNLSLGSPCGFNGQEKGYYDYDLARSFDKARKAGIIVSVAAGNDNKIGLGSINSSVLLPYVQNPDYGLVGSPSTNYSATSVASIENIGYTASYLKFGNTKILYSDTNNTFVNTFDGQALNFEYCGLGKDADFDNIELSGKVALIQRGEISFDDKISNATSNGAIGVIIFNHDNDSTTKDELISMKLTNNTPSVFIGNTNGLEIKNNPNGKIEISNSFMSSFTNKDLGKMSKFSSWGTTSDLQLKPEITAPGGDIYSTISNNKYETMSGTSMATPHVAGGAALIEGYAKNDDKFKRFTDTERTNIVENILMSTATIIKDNENDTIYSPRKQGSGLMNLKAAVETGVYLINNETKKAKVELGDNINDNYTVSFNIVNISNQNKEFILKGNSITDANDGKYILPKSYIINSNMTYNNDNLTVLSKSSTGSSIEISGDAKITVPANSSIPVEINVSLNNSETTKLKSIFTNGFFIEGFIELVSTDSSNPTLSIPYLGFYGNWGNVPIFDKLEAYGEKNAFYGKEAGCGLAYSPTTDSELGSDMHSNFNLDYISISPTNADEIFDDITLSLGTLRNMRDIYVDIKDKDGKIIKHLYEDVFVRKAYYNASAGYVVSTYLGRDGTVGNGVWNGQDENGDTVKDGQYYYEVNAKVDYPGAKYQRLTIPVFVDNTAPYVKESYIEKVDEKDVLTITIADNHFLKAAFFKDKDDNMISYNTTDIVGKEKTFTFDVTEDLKTAKAEDKTHIKLTTFDMAHNTTEINFNLVDIVNNPVKSNKPDDSNNGNNNDSNNDNDSNNNDSNNNDSNNDVNYDYNTNYTSYKPPTLIEIANDCMNIGKDNITYKNYTKSRVASVNSRNIIYSIKDKKDITLNINIEKNDKYTTTKLSLDTSLTSVLNTNNIKLNIICDDINIETNSVQKGDLIFTIKSDNENNINLEKNYNTSNISYNISAKCDDKELKKSNYIITFNTTTIDALQQKQLGIYSIDSKGNPKYEMTYTDGDSIYCNANSLGTYAILLYDKKFNDISSHWAKEYIENIASKHITNGKPNNMFKPNDIITRAEFITMVVRALSLEGNVDNTISNFIGNEWYANSVNLAKNVGLISGKIYNAEGIISRYEMAEIISKAHALLNNMEILNSDVKKFTDTENNKYISYAVENNLITGFDNGLFKPVENSTRAQAITVLYRLITK